MYGCESWTIKEAERRRVDAFELWYYVTNRIHKICRLEIQERADVTVLSLKPVGQASRLETQARILCYSVEAEFLLEKPGFCSSGLQLID